jgi:WD40 repeat protein
VAFAPDGIKVATGGRDNVVKVWDASTRPGPVVLADDKKQKGLGEFDVLAFTPDGGTLLAARNDEVRLWDVAGGGVRKRLNYFGNDRSELAWWLEVQPQRDWPANGDLTRLAVSPDGKWCAATGDLGTKVWDLSTGEPVARLRGAGEAAWFSPDGSTLAAEQKQWNVGTWRERKQEARPATTDVECYAPDGNTFTTLPGDASGANVIVLHDTATGEVHCTLRGHTAKINSVAFSADGRTLASASLDKSIRLWDAKTGEQKHLLEGHLDAVVAVAFTPDGSTVVSAGGHAVKFWDPVTSQERLTLSFPGWFPRRLAFAPNGRLLAVSWIADDVNAPRRNMITIYRAGL